jgi:hypothetical protein
MPFGYLVLVTAVLISLIAAYYSIMGLVAIFAAAAIPVIVMGSALEVGKIVATVWLHNNWKRAPWQFKAYLIPAVVLLMFITSMGIFGFLSKAHLDQNIISGDSQSRVSIFDEKIKTEQDNINAARAALRQMDAQVDQVLGRTTDDKGAERAVQIRRQQAAERTRLQRDIETSQNKLTKLREERAPIAAEFRKIEAEVGPIKYVAALIYGDQTDQNMLEKAVRWVIILIVIVFDPLALCLILASNKQFEWAIHGQGGWVHEDDDHKAQVEKTDRWDKIRNFWPLNKKQKNIVEEQLPVEQPVERPTERSAEDSQPVTDTWPYPVGQQEGPKTVDYTVLDDADEEIENKEVSNLKEVDDTVVKKELEETKLALMILADDYNKLQSQNETSLQRNLALQNEIDQIKKNIESISAAQKEEITDEVAETQVEEITELEALDTQVEEITELKDPNPVKKNDFAISAMADNSDTPNMDTNADFGINFPSNPRKGDMFIRVDFLPTKLFKWNGRQWIEVDKNNNSSYTYNEQYIVHLIDQLEKGQYNIEDINDAEREEIERYINRKNG